MTEGAAMPTGREAVESMLRSWSVTLTGTATPERQSIWDAEQRALGPAARLKVGQTVSRD